VGKELKERVNGRDQEWLGLIYLAFKKDDIRMFLGMVVLSIRYPLVDIVDIEFLKANVVDKFLNYSCGLKTQFRSANYSL
jgi:hypothetical protein